MNLSIRDAASLATVQSENVQLYLTSSGWSVLEERPGSVSFGLSVEGGLEEVLLPTRETYRDYPLRISELLHAVARIEKRSVLNLFRSIQFVTSDIVEISAVSNNSFTRCKLNTAANMIQNTKELLLAAASASSTRQIQFQARRPPEALEFINSLRIAVVDGSTFTLRILSDLQTGGTPVPIPFRRLVLMTLADALKGASDLRESVQTFMPGTENADTILLPAVERGASVNLYESLVKLFGDESSTVSIQITFSPLVPRESRPSFVFPKENYEPLLSFAANSLRVTAQRLASEPVSIRGQIVTLQRPTRSRAGKVVIEAEVEFEHRRISAELGEADYAIAVDAHKAQRMVEVTGILEKRARSSILRQPRDLVLR